MFFVSLICGHIRFLVVAHHFKASTFLTFMIVIILIILIVINSFDPYFPVSGASYAIEIE